MNSLSGNLGISRRSTCEALSIFVFVFMLFVLAGVDSARAQDTVSRFAYVPNNNGISIYTVNVKTGQLRSNGYVFEELGMIAAAVDHSERFVYAVNVDFNTISAYTIDASTGQLTAVTGSPYATGVNPVSVTVDASNQFVYVANQGSNNISAYALDSTTGALTPVTGSPFASGLGPVSVAITPSGNFAYACNANDSPGGDVSAYTVDATTGALTTIAGSPFLPQSGGFGLTLSPSGDFGYVGGNDVVAFSINPTTGVPTAIPDSPVAPTGTNYIAVSPSGKYVYATGGTNGISGFSVNATTGKLTLLKGSPFASGEYPSYMTIDASGTRLYVTDFGSSASGSNDVWTFKIAGGGGLTLLNEVRTPSLAGGVALVSGSAAVTYTPTFAYVANSGSGNISGYAINAKNGHLTGVSGSPFTAGTNTYAVTTDPSGRFAYAANEGSNSVSAYTIDASTGALTAVSGSPYPAGAGSDAVAVDPSGRFVYVANGGSGNPNIPSLSAYTINTSTGALTAVSGSPYATGGATTTSVSVTVDPTGQFVYVSNMSLILQSGSISAFTINAGTGALTTVTGSPFGGVSSPNSVAVDASGRFAYVANEGTINFSYVISAFEIAPTTGALNLLSYSSSLGANTSWVAADPWGQFVYAAQIDTGVLALSFNSTTDALALLSDSACSGNPIAAAIDPSGKFAYGANPAPDNTINACAIDKTTGNLTPISGEFAIAAGTNPVSVVTTGTIQ